MLQAPTVKKRVPQIGMSTSPNQEYVDIRVMWKTIKIPMYRYNGNTLISTDIGLVEDISEDTWKTEGDSLPGQNASGETSTDYVEYTGIEPGLYVYARVRIGRHTGGWGAYGYMKQLVVVAGSGVPGPQGPQGETGAQGPAGEDGQDAPTFYVSTEDPDNEVGIDGDFWVKYTE